MTKDPEVRYGGANNTAVARFSVAVDRKFKRENEETADFINCISFGKTAEFIEKYFHKGMRINVQGEWRTGSYTNKDGVKVYTNDCMVSNVEFGESKGSNGDKNKQKADGDGFVNIPEGIDEQLPFN